MFQWLSYLRVKGLSITFRSQFYLRLIHHRLIYVGSYNHRLHSFFQQLLIYHIHTLFRRRILGQTSSVILIGSDETMTNSRKIVLQKPNQFTNIFGTMKQLCPQHIEAYAQCVILHQKDGTLNHGSCNAEFQLVKQCFRSIRLKSR